MAHSINWLWEISRRAAALTPQNQVKIMTNVIVSVVNQQQLELLRVLVSTIPGMRIVDEMVVNEHIENTTECIKAAILVMNEEKLFKNRYDYTWLKLALDCMSLGVKFDSAESFRCFLLTFIAEEETPSESTISKKMVVARGELFNWHYSDCKNEQERQRRNNIVKRFFHLIRQKS